MKKLFVPYSLAKQLKQIGFDVFCLGFYDADGTLFPNVQEVSTCRDILQNEKLYPEYDADDTVFIEYSTQLTSDIAAPVWEQVIAWFREKHKIVVSVYHEIDFENLWWSSVNDMKTDRPIAPNTEFKKYNAALKFAVAQAIKIVQTKNK